MFHPINGIIITIPNPTQTPSYLSTNHAIPYLTKVGIQAINIIKNRGDTLGIKKQLSYVVTEIDLFV